MKVMDVTALGKAVEKADIRFKVRWSQENEQK